MKIAQGLKDYDILLKGIIENDIIKHELRVASYELRVTS